MIALTRIRTEAAILAKYRGKSRIDYNVKLLKQQQEILQGTKSRFIFTKIWGEAKTQLMAETCYKCAYCEKLIDTIGADKKESSFADVEHYRPSSIYWWLAYCYENYLYACEICNRSYKKDKFPTLYAPQMPPYISIRSSLSVIQKRSSKMNPDSLNQKQGQRWANFKKLHQKERPFILNPYFDEPTQFFGYEVDKILQEVKIFVLLHLPNAADYQAAIDNDLGLNRISLKQDRYQYYETYAILKEVLQESNISETLKNKTIAKIHKMQQNNAPYSGMIRYFEKHS